MTALALTAVSLLFATLAGNLLYLRRHRPDERPGGRAPSVTIFIPARDEEDHIGRLIDSIARQTYPHLHVRIYDDASSDATPEILARYASDMRFEVIRGEGAPPGWMGKVHALYRATRDAPGDIFLFLDADVELLRPDSLERLVGVKQNKPPDAVLTALPWLRGGGLSLVSLIPFVILTMLPWFLVRSVPLRRMGALNGQCWMISAEAYRRTEPHLRFQDEVLEDVRIGQYLRSLDLIPTLVDLRHDLAVRMYGSLAEAWQGLLKNAYPMAGGRPATFFLAVSAYAWLFLVMPLVDLRVGVGVILAKIITDRIARMPPVVSILAPFSYLLGFAVQLGSAVGHWRGTVTWKGRSVARGTAGSAPPRRDAP